MNKEKELIDKLIDLAFAEDIGDGDHTTLSCIPATAMGKSKLLIKEVGVLSGMLCTVTSSAVSRVAQIICSTSFFAP